MYLRSRAGKPPSHVRSGALLVGVRPNHVPRARWEAVHDRPERDPPQPQPLERPPDIGLGPMIRHRPQGVIPVRQRPPAATAATSHEETRAPTGPFGHQTATDRFRRPVGPRHRRPGDLRHERRWQRKTEPNAQQGRRFPALLATSGPRSRIILGSKPVVARFGSPGRDMPALSPWFRICRRACVPRRSSVARRRIASSAG